MWFRLRWALSFAATLYTCFVYDNSWLMPLGFMVWLLLELLINDPAAFGKLLGYGVACAVVLLSMSNFFTFILIGVPLAIATWVVAACDSNPVKHLPSKLNKK